MSQYHTPLPIKANPSHLLVMTQNFPPSSQEIDKAFHKESCCHNYIKEGHYFTSCPRPRVSYKQRELNKAQIEELEISSRVMNGVASLSKPITTVYC